MNTFILTCITCQKTVEADSTLVGEIVVCPFCSSMVLVAPSVAEEPVAEIPGMSPAPPPVVAPPVQSVAPPVVDSVPPVIAQELPTPSHEQSSWLPNPIGGFRAYPFLFAPAGVALILLLLLSIALFYSGSSKNPEEAMVAPTTSIPTVVPDLASDSPATVATGSEKSVPQQPDNQSVIETSDILTGSTETAITIESSPIVTSAESSTPPINSGDEVTTTPTPATGLPGRKSSHPDADETVDPADDENSPDNDFLAGSGVSQNLQSALSTVTGKVKDTPTAEQLLALPVESISLPHSNIVALMNFISTISGAAIIFDSKQIGLLRPLWNQHFSINQERTTLKKMLDEGVSKSSMQQREEDGIVILEPKTTNAPPSTTIELDNIVASEQLLAPERIAWDKLKTLAAITTVEPIALAELIELLGNRYQIRFLFDDNAMAQVGVTRQSRINVRAEETSVAQLLNVILAPLDLGWVIFGEDLIEISSREKATNYSTIEVHSFAIPGKETTEAEIQELIKKIQEGIPQAIWSTETTDNPNAGVIKFDLPNSCLIVRQNQPVQRQLRDWLERHLP